MISVIIPAHNEEAWIGRSVTAATAAVDSAGGTYECLVVDDASTDRTAELARTAGARVLPVAHRQISATRNAGAREARGDWFFFVDADTLLSTAIVEEALQAMGRGAAGGGCIPHFEGRLPLWVRGFYPAMTFAARHVLRQTGGACLFCTRDAFAATGGFSEAHFAAEEDGWVKALKRHGRFVIPNARVTTSGRNLRAYSFWEIARILLRFAMRGPKAFQDRRGLELWYEPKREKPASRQ